MDWMTLALTFGLIAVVGVALVSLGVIIDRRDKHRWDEIRAEWDRIWDDLEADAARPDSLPDFDEETTS